ncbi:hypothetical protein NPIL_493961 [Nephila pilipes]|uniref:Uncharacterized protein n=1 Tax=Nephila pilipes TaxID=299642 RepID=A0A8X6QAC0_NEPPI|nr:hypothetical protein NPIL_493961 [Nephila pilipes]
MSTEFFPVCLINKRVANKRRKACFVNTLVENKSPLQLLLANKVISIPTFYAKLLFFHFFLPDARPIHDRPFISGALPGVINSRFSTNPLTRLGMPNAHAPRPLLPSLSEGKLFCPINRRKNRSPQDEGAFD